MSAYKIEIGEAVRVRKMFFYETQIAYAGMPSADIYSLVIVNTEAHNSWSFNLYVPVRKKEIKISKGTIRVVRVDENSVEFEFLKN
jgi:hypothetical protein